MIILCVLVDILAENYIYITYITSIQYYVSGVVYDVYSDYRYYETERGEGEITLETGNLVLVNFF